MMMNGQISQSWQCEQQAFAKTKQQWKFIRRKKSFATKQQWNKKKKTAEQIHINKGNINKNSKAKFLQVLSGVVKLYRSTKWKKKEKKRKSKTERNKI